MPAYDDISLSRRDVARLLGLSTAVAAGSLQAAPSVTTPNLTTAVGIADAIRKRKVSASEVLELHVKRIEASNKELNAFVYLDLDAARKAAKEIDRRIGRGEDPGPLAGVPYGVKDLYDAAGMPTSRGSLIYKNQPPMRADSTHVARVRKAGAVILGKTAAPEFGMSSITSSRAWGVTRNPWNPALSPGGSSGGATAAVASGMMALGSGSDAGGSIRSPAAFTGLVGLKPSHGRIGREIPSDTSAHGCLSLTVADTARFLDVAAGPTPTDRNSLPKPEVSYERLIETLNVAGLRAAWSPDFGFIPTEQECIDVARRAADKLVSAAKMHWVDREFRSVDPVPSWGLLAMSHLRGDLELDGVYPAKADLLNDRLRKRFEPLGSLKPMDLSRADQMRRQIEEGTAKFFEDVDVLFSPVTTLVSIPAEGPVPETIAGRDARSTGAEAHLMLANFTWQPAISVPAGLSASGFPIGLQIICRRWRDDVALRLARILEQAEPWPHRAPAYRS
jgi:aspartyl-tRNA(Asn)/glutamyl-tRNA(Gln) amidotransferase subunit A